MPKEIRPSASRLSSTRKFLNMEDTPNKNAIGIYIFGHALLSSDSILTSPPGIKITKSNLGGYGCLSYPTSLERRPEPNSIALGLTKDMNYAITCDEYKEFTHGSLDRKTGRRIDSHNYTIDKDGSCQMFKGNSKWVSKQYLPGAKIIFAYGTKTCDLMTIQYEYFKHLFGIKHYDENSNEFRTLNKISKLFELRTTEGITTTLIFYILYLFNKIYHVETVRIIDESCNAELDKSKQVYYEKLDGTWVTNYRALSKEAIKPLAENIGYGGKKKKNRNRNRTRKK